MEYTTENPEKQIYKNIFPVWIFHDFIQIFYVPWDNVSMDWDMQSKIAPQIVFITWVKVGLD